MSDDGGPTPPPRRQRPWIVLSLEEALLDVRPAILHVIHLLSGATPADVAALEATGVLDDPWDLARAAHPWIRAGRPMPLPVGDWRAIVNQCGADTGDLHARAQRLYRELGWRAEASRIDAVRLSRLADVAHVAVVTDRDASGLARAETCFGFRFAHRTTAEDGARPDPDMLLRHGATGHFLGRGARDRATAEAARFVFHDVGTAPALLVDRMIARLAEPIAAVAPVDAPAAPPPEGASPRRNLRVPPPPGAVARDRAAPPAPAEEALRASGDTQGARLRVSGA